MASPTHDGSILLIHYVPMLDSPSARTLHDASTPAGKAWKIMISNLESAEGCEKVWWSFQLDNEDNVGIFALFSTSHAQSLYETTHPVTSLQTTLAPILSATYPSFTSKRFSIALPSASLLTTTFSAPITKIWTWWFPLPTNTTSQAFDSTHIAEAYLAFVAANTTGHVSASTSGWRREEDVIREIPARSFSGFVGCERVEDFRMTPPFEENIGGRIGMGMRTFRMGEGGGGVV